MLQVILTDTVRERIYEGKILYTNFNPQDLHSISIGKPTHSKILIATVASDEVEKVRGGGELLQVDK